MGIKERVLGGIEERLLETDNLDYPEYEDIIELTLQEVNLTFEKTETKINNYFEETTEGNYKIQTRTFLNNTFNELKSELGD